MGYTFIARTKGGRDVTVYADVLFIVNWSLDFVTLYITGRLMSLSMVTWRMCLSASLGAAFATAALIFDMDGVVYGVASVAVCGSMCVCAYKKAGAFGYFGASVLMFAVGSALGGAMTAISSVGRGYRDSLNGGTEGGELLFSVAATAAAITAAAGRIAGRRSFAGTRRVTVVDGGRSRTLSALADSGSFLREPLSGRPALVVRANTVAEVLPAEVIAAALADDTALAVESISPSLLSRIRILPVSGVAGDGILLGYRPDEVTVSSHRGRRNVDCFLAISRIDGDFGGHDAIIPAELL